MASGVGRPRTGRTTKVIRVPKELDEKKFIQLYNTVYPVLHKYVGVATASKTSPRTKLLREMFEEMGWILDDRDLNKLD